MNYAIMDQATQKQLNSQLEQDNIFTKIDISEVDTSTDSDFNKENLPVIPSSFFDVCKGILGFIKNLIIKIFGD